MDNVEKLQVILQHWIDHNKGHVDEFETWRKVMADENRDKVAGFITEAVKKMAEVNAELGKALHEVGGPQQAGGDSHHHHHHHDNNHDHDHDHDHHHSHSHKH